MIFWLLNLHIIISTNKKSNNFFKSGSVFQVRFTQFASYSWIVDSDINSSKQYLKMMLKRNRRNPISFSLLNSSQALNTWHLEAAVASILHLYPLIQQYFTIVLHNISSPLSSNPKIFQITLDLTTSTYPTLAMWLQTYYFPRDFYDVWFIASFLQSICNIQI